MEQTISLLTYEHPSNHYHYDLESLRVIHSTSTTSSVSLMVHLAITETPGHKPVNHRKSQHPSLLPPIW